MPQCGVQELALLRDRGQRSGEGSQAAPAHVSRHILVLYMGWQEADLLLFKIRLFQNTTLQLLVIGKAVCLGSDPDLNFREGCEILGST